MHDQDSLIRRLRPWGPPRGVVLHDQRGPRVLHAARGRVSTGGDPSGLPCIRGEAEALGALLAGAGWRAALRAGVSTDDLGALQWLSAVAEASRPAPTPPSPPPARPEQVGLAAAVGTAQEFPAVRVTPAAIEAMASVTHDTSVAYVGPQAVAPPALHAQVLSHALVALMRDPAVAADTVRLLHLHHDLHLARPLQPWEVVVPRLTLRTVAQKRGGLLVVGDLEGFVAARRVLWARTAFFVVGQQRLEAGVVLGAPPAAPEPEPDRGPPSRTHSWQVPPGFAAAYAGASGDHNPLHLDPAVAAQAGLPQCPVHGLSTLARAGVFVVGDVAFGDPRGVFRLSGAFRAPVYEGDTLTAQVWPDPRGAGARFVVENQEGACVLSHGVLTLRL